ncbi:hypothetical protein [Mesoplasma seiffertii]|uniref:hypothetical protein n=1 Tax=Mesoplasma seiffertii TaxID=28224 RepID=UPI0004790E9E|nr:hypothetical protein [Mesoplasma seiffertii]
MFKKEFQAMVDKFGNLSTTNINDKVGRDFLKFLVTSENIEISAELFEKFIQSVKIVAACNKHEFVRQSDLFAILEVEQTEIKNLDEVFEKSLRATMFRELNIYLEANIMFKDQATIDFENNAISEEQIEHAELLINWTTAKIKELEDSIELVIHGEQLTNILTGIKAAQFYEQAVREIITMLKWHLVGFQIIKNFKKK